VYNVKGVKVKFKHFNAQRTRTSAVDYAVKKGFSKLLKDIVLEEYQTEDLAKDIDFKKSDLVEKLNIVSEDTSKGGYLATFDILYNESKVKQILKERRIPFTQESMGKVLLLAVKETSSGRRLLFEDFNDFKSTIEELLQGTSLIEPIFPKGDIDEVTAFSPYNILDAYNQEKILKLAEKYETDKVIVALVSKKDVTTPDAYNLHIKFINIDKLTTYNTLIMGKSIRSVSIQASSKIKDLWKKSHLLEFNKPKKFIASIATKGDIDKLDDIIAKLNEMPIVAGTVIVELNHSEALISTNFYGSPSEFLEGTEKAGLTVFQSQDKRWFVDYSQSREIENQGTENQ